MTSNSFWTAMSKVSTAVTVMLIATLVLATSAAAEYKILYQFKMAHDGANPTGKLILDAVGNLYGATSAGGAYGSGTVFKLAPNPGGSWKESVLYSFTGGAEGGNPVGLIFDQVGNLYGTTYGGGFRCGGPQGGGCGVVFRLGVYDWFDSSVRRGLLRCRQQLGHGRQHPPEDQFHNVAAPSG